MGWLLAAGLATWVIYLLRANYAAEKKWRGLRYCWTMLAQRYADAWSDSPEVASAELRKQKQFLTHVNVRLMSKLDLALYEAALEERGIEKLD